MMYGLLVVLLFIPDVRCQQFTDIADLDYYEVVKLHHLDKRGRTRRDLSTLSRNHDPHLDENHDQHLDRNHDRHLDENHNRHLDENHDQHLDENHDQHLDWNHNRHLDENHNRHLDENHDQHLEETTFAFSGHNRYFHINMYKNTVLIPHNFENIFQRSNGSYGSRKNVEHCYYHGYLANRTKSFAVLNTCYGFRGVIRDDDSEEFVVEPYVRNIDSTSSGEFILFKSSDVRRKQNKNTCGVLETNEYHKDESEFPLGFFPVYQVEGHHRTRRSNANTKYVEIIVVLDQAIFKEHRGDIDATQHRAFEIFNIVDSIYKTVNTRVAVVNMLVWNIYNMATVSDKAHETLTSFEQYTRDVLRNELRLTFDNAQLLSTKSWGNLAGLAGVGVICSPTSAAVNRDHNANAAITANTVAHEMGHNIGFMHNTKSCVCHKKPCVMSSDVPWEPCQSFTDCAQQEYVKRLSRGDLPCLLDFPGKLFGKPVCGNGYVEEGEECDCGGAEECRKMNLHKCCNSTTCRLQQDAQCAMGPCCENCLFKTRGTLCRGRVNQDCDLEEFCTGASGKCPKNFHLQDGTSCRNGTAYCYQGACKTHEAQCEMLWGANGTKADDICFTINTHHGNEWGNCGRDVRNDYIRCKPEDELCGKTQCIGKSPKHVLPKYPVIGHNRARRKVTFKLQNRSISCISGSTSVGSDLQDPTMAAAGVKCGHNKICIDHRCTNITSLPHITKCSRQCFDRGGVCNNNGNCHCPKGKSCPYCDIAGPGGSVDSGQGCVVADRCSDCFTFWGKVLLAFVVVLVPMFGVGCWCYCNWGSCRDKCCVQKQLLDEQRWSSSDGASSEKDVCSDSTSDGGQVLSPLVAQPFHLESVYHDF